MVGARGVLSCKHLHNDFIQNIHFYFTAGIVDTMLKKREEQRLIKIENGVICY